jgi:hypothetical protein
MDPVAFCTPFFLQDGMVRKAVSCYCPLRNDMCQCCGSGMFIPDPGSWFLSIPDLKTARGVWKKYRVFVVLPSFVATNITKFKIILFFHSWRNNFGPIHKELPIEQKKIVIKLTKLWVWDLRSGIRKNTIPNPGSGVQKGTGSWIRIRNTVWCRDDVLGAQAAGLQGALGLSCYCPLRNDTCVGAGMTCWGPRRPACRAPSCGQANTARGTNTGKARSENKKNSGADPDPSDPYVFGPPRSWSIS